MPNTITEPTLSNSFNFQPSPPPTVELDADQFLDGLDEILKNGFEREYSTEFMTSQILDFAKQNPLLAKQLQIPNDYLEIRNLIVKPLKLKHVSSTEKTVPTLNLISDRKNSIVKNTDSRFRVAENPKANGKKPIYEWAARSQVSQFDSLIEKEATAQKLDPDFVRAIVYMETTHGYYPDVKTLRPMNVHAEFWKELGYSRSDLQNPELNIRAGVTILKRIKERVASPTIDKVATLYNALAKEEVSDYGARVGQIYLDKPWKQSNP